MINTEDLRTLRSAYADACDEVAFYCERDGECPSHVLAHAEALRRALAEDSAAYAEAS